MNINPFIEQYSKLKNSDLLKIIDSPDDYQPLAIEAAQEVLEKRHLNEEELIEAKENIIYLKSEGSIVQDKMKSISRVFLASLKPVVNNDKSQDSYILILCLFLGILFIVDLFNFFSSFDGSIIGVNTYTLFFFLILNLVSAILFWKRTKIGWILLSIFLTHLSFIYLYAYSGAFESKYPFLPILEMSVAVIPLVFICRRTVRKIYSINKMTMAITIGATIAFTTLMWNIFLYY